MDYVDWSWPKMDELDVVAYQSGIRLALENGVTSYSEILGMDWKAKLQQIADERAWLREHGITHPADLLISGGETAASKSASEIPD